MGAATYWTRVQETVLNVEDHKVEQTLRWVPSQLLYEPSNSTFLTTIVKSQTGDQHPDKENCRLYALMGWDSPFKSQHTKSCLKSDVLDLCSR